MTKRAGQPEPGSNGYLEVTTAAEFNREMQYDSMPYRMQKLTGRREDRGHWVLFEIRGHETLHQIPPMPEEYAVHVMRAWIYGMTHAQGIEYVGRMMRGELEGEA